MNPEPPVAAEGSSATGPVVGASAGRFPNPVQRVDLSDKAVALLAELTGIHGPLMFHQSGGCCDGSSPMCYPAGEFVTGPQDVLLAEL